MKQKIEKGFVVYQRYKLLNSSNHLVIHKVEFPICTQNWFETAEDAIQGITEAFPHIYDEYLILQEVRIVPDW